jgi:hypothetical protein
MLRTALVCVADRINVRSATRVISCAANKRQQQRLHRCCKQSHRNLRHSMHHQVQSCDQVSCQQCHWAHSPAFSPRVSQPVSVSPTESPNVAKCVIDSDSHPNMSPIVLPTGSAVISVATNISHCVPHANNMHKHMYKHPTPPTVLFCANF